MNRVSRLLGSVLMLFIGALNTSYLCAEERLHAPIAHKGSSGNLAELLRFVSEQYRIPIIGELVYPVPENRVFESGQDTAVSLLAKLLRQVPAYSYDITNGHIIRFYRRDVVDKKGNFLNVRLKHFTMPANLADFKLLLPSAIDSARKGLPGSGSVTSGFASREMENGKLTQKELSNISARDLLIMAAEETSAFYSIVVLESRNCQTDACFNYANQHWFWGSLTGSVSENRIYIQHPRLPGRGR